jgi:hypothetical protein
MKNNSGLTVQSLTDRLEVAKNNLNEEIKEFTGGTTLGEFAKSFENVFSSRAFFNVLWAAIDLDTNRDDDEHEHSATLLVVSFALILSVASAGSKFLARKRQYERLVTSLSNVELIQVLLECDLPEDANYLLLALEQNYVEQGFIPTRRFF